MAALRHVGGEARKVLDARGPDPMLRRPAALVRRVERLGLDARTHAAANMEHALMIVELVAFGIVVGRLISRCCGCGRSAEGPRPGTARTRIVSGDREWRP